MLCNTTTQWQVTFMLPLCFGCYFFWTLNSLCSNLCVKLCFFHIYTHISSRGQHILFFKWERFRSLLSSKVYYSCRWLNEGHRVCPTIFIERQGAKQHHRVQSNMTCTSVLLWGGEHCSVSDELNTFRWRHFKPISAGYSTPPPLCPVMSCCRSKL